MILQKLTVALLLLSGIHSYCQETWTSKYVSINKKGELVYNADEKGNIIPDFSSVGYHGNQKQIPFIRVVKHLSPSDNSQQQIQAAIDEVSKMKPDANGFRGAIHLSAGNYKIPGVIN